MDEVQAMRSGRLVSIAGDFATRDCQTTVRCDLARRISGPFFSGSQVGDGTHDCNCSYPGGGGSARGQAPPAIYCPWAMRCTVLTATPWVAAITRTPGRPFLRSAAWTAASNSARDPWAGE